MDQIFIMSEIISIHLGEAGVKIGESLWNLYCNEQKINSSGMKVNDTNPHSLFSETSTGKWEPRCIFADLDPVSIANLKPNELFKQKNLISGREDTSSNYIRGHCTIGRDISENIFESIRKETEACENLQGFIISHSVGGGTGSGLNTTVLEIISAYYCDKVKIDLTVFPSNNLSPVIVEPYNAVLSFEGIIQSSDACIVLDNRKIFSICEQKLDIERPTFKNLNNFIANSVSSIFGPAINGGSINTTLNEFTSNLIPMKDLKFLSTSVSPIMNQEQSFRETLSVSQITEQVFGSSFNQTSINLNTSKTLACTLAFKGEIVPNDLNSAANFAKLRFSEELLERKLNSGYDETLMTRNFQNDFGNLDKSVCLVRNSTGVVEIFDKVCMEFDKMYSKRAFVHWFSGEGLSEGYFEGAREQLASLIDSLNKA